ncbi:MAG: (Fe-S)-binding protein [Erysipelotrichaceae bacterium]
MISAVLMMLVLGALLGLGLGFADKVLKVEVDTRVEQVTTMLPGYNCGGCGYPGCSGLAEALVAKEADAVSLCKPSKADARTAIIDYLAATPGPDGSVITLKK